MVMTMCQTGTGGRGKVWLAAVLLTALPAFSQTRPDWRRVGSSLMDLALASPATGPVRRVWFAADGSRLYALTADGRTFESADMETWAASSNPAAPPETVSSQVKPPTSGVRLFADPQDRQRIFALGAHLYRSDNAGASWTNLTAFGDASVIGAGQHDLAVSPRDPDLLIVANDYGVWRSADGGLSWSGLNQSLPNLRVRRILATPQGLDGTRVAVEGVGLLELQPGGDRQWKPSTDVRLSAQLVSEAARRQVVSAKLGAEITALGGSGDILYAGASDGRIWISQDKGQTWPVMRPGSGAPVKGFYADAQDSRIALAVVGGKGAHVLRTINTGVTWDDITANLPDAPANAVAADRASGAVYVATDRGVFYATVDFDRA